jgi:hypothetical protein
MDLGIRKFREDLVGAGQVELGDVGEEQEADLERHGIPHELGRVLVAVEPYHNLTSKTAFASQQNTSPKTEMGHSLQ